MPHNVAETFVCINWFC